MRNCSLEGYAGSVFCGLWCVEFVSVRQAITINDRRTGIYIGRAQHATLCLSASRRPVRCHDRLTSHLRSPSPCRTAPHPPADPHTLDDILITGPCHFTAAPSDLQGTVQRRVLNVLARS